jgi:hypothetical protein
MRTKLRGKISLLFIVCAALLAIPAIALADVVGNNIDATLDNTAEVMPLQAGGANGTTKLYVQPTGTGGGLSATFPDPTNTGCNLSGAANLQVDVSSSNPSVATVSPASATINDCGEPNGVTLTVSPVAAGSTTVTVARKAGTTGSATGNFAFGPATFTVNVTPPPNTPPTVTVAGVTGGASYDKGSVPNATCQVTDTEDGPSSFAATLGPITGPNASDGIGSQEATCSYTDHGPGPGLTATASVFYNIVDPSGPVITKVVTPASPNGDNGWYKSNVTVDWTVSDPQSPNSLQLNGCQDQNITADQAEQTYSCSATSAGGSAPEQSVTIKRDATPPNITLGGVSGTAGNNDWYTSVVSQTFNATDALSDLAGPASFTRDSGANEEGQTVNIASGPVSDNAGNTASRSAGPFKIDLSDPEANCDSAPSGWSQNDVNIHCQASDAISGLANTGDASFDLSTSVPNGTETANASTDDRVVTDAAGRSVTAGPISGIKVDKKAPVLTDEGPTTTPDGDNGWYKSAVTNGFKATDGGSGFAPSGDLTKSFTKSSGTNEGGAVKIASDAVSDAVGNSAASIDSAAFKIDLSNPTNVTFSGGPNAGGEYFFGDTPDKPTCTANDNVSGFASCEVTGYSTAVGSHTMTATAKDNAGRTATETRSYTVKAWTTKGFYQPVDMGDVLNTVKNGSTVPVKFELFKGTNELTSTSAVSSISAKTVSCAAFTGDPEDAIETVATGGTILRYDATGGQFIYNWQTPKKPNTCYNLTMTAADSSTITAYFKLK